MPGPTPLHLIDKPTPGTGATLLANSLLLPAVGTNLTTRAGTTHEEEMRKRLTAVLMQLPTGLLLDNLSGKLDSSVLSSALSATTYEDRLLGASANISIPVKTAWVGTGNNVQLSTELTRRSVPIRLDAKADRPWLREVAFKHPDLPQWAHQHRGVLVHALLTLWSAWLSEKRPSGDSKLGGYESWAAVIGGVLQVAGVNGFLQNLEDLYERADADGDAQRAFIAEWWDKHGSKRVSASALLKVAVEANVPLRSSADQQPAELGILLRSLLGRHYDITVNGKVQTVVVTKASSGKGTPWALKMVTA